MNFKLIFILSKFILSYQIIIPKNLFGCPTVDDWNKISIKNSKNDKNLEFCSLKNGKTFLTPSKRFCKLDMNCDRNFEMHNLIIYDVEFFGNLTFGNLNNENLDINVCCMNSNDNQQSHVKEYIAYSTLIVSQCIYKTFYLFLSYFYYRKMEKIAKTLTSIN